jgi:hypothetical protein
VLKDEASADRQAAGDGLRSDVPTDDVEDVMVDGASWDRID